MPCALSSSASQHGCPSSQGSHVTSAGQPGPSDEVWARVPVLLTDGHLGRSIVFMHVRPLS